MNRIIFHIDFDYFYAQCEEIRRPDLKTKPVAVCVFSDRGGDSGAIATANYTARKFGVKSGMPITFAKNLLKRESNAVFLPTDFDYYSDMSQKTMNVIKEFADIFEYVGRDEAYLDVTKSTKGKYDKASQLALQIKDAIIQSTKISCSIGITPNKLLSKIASDFEKPDGLTIVSTENVMEFLAPLKIRDIPYIGKKTEAKFSEMDLKTIKDLRKLDIFTLHQQFGRKIGTYIHNAARGIDNEPVAESEPSVQYSKIVTLKKDSNEYEFLLESLNELCTELHQVVLKNKRLFKSVGIQFVQSDLSQKSKSRMLRNPTSNLEELQKNAGQLLKDALEDQSKLIRRLGVKVF